MPLITLTTDFGLKDHFVGVIKGAIYTRLPEARIVDLSHNISPFNVNETAYILKSAYKKFPDGTTHIIGVDSEHSKNNKHIAIALDNHFFVCSDNGIISMITSDLKPSKVVELHRNKGIQGSSPVLDVFVKAACTISKTGNLDAVGTEIKELKKLTELKPKVNQTQIKGTVIYIDNYGNVITNITEKIFQEVGKNRPFKITVAHQKYSKVYHKYNDIVAPDSENPRKYDGNSLALFNSESYLEIAIYRSDLHTVGGASTLFGLGFRDPIFVDFEDV